MTNQVKISIIIPSFKPQNYLWECLESIKKQTLSSTDFEVILILNGPKEPYYSNIETVLAAEPYKSFAKLIYTEIKGVSNARNIGMDESKGDFIAFIDDDDMVSPTYLAEMLEIAEKGKIPITYILRFSDTLNEVDLSYISKKFIKYEKKGYASILQLRPYMSGPVCKLIPKSIIQNKRFNVNYQNGEDGLFMAHISDKIRYLTLTSRNAIYYRRVRLGSLTQSQSKKQAIRNGLLLSVEFLLMYLKNPFVYNPLFFLTRIAASLRKVVFALWRG